MKAWKLFEEKEVNGIIVPRTLVHGVDGSRTLALDRQLVCQFGTPGFNLFLSENDLLDYLPRFRIRKSKLVYCIVDIHESYFKLFPKTNYAFSETIFISSEEWENRKNEYSKVV